MEKIYEQPANDAERQQRLIGIAQHYVRGEIDPETVNALQARYRFDIGAALLALAAQEQDQANERQTEE